MWNCVGVGVRNYLRLSRACLVALTMSAMMLVFSDTKLATVTNNTDGTCTVTVAVSDDATDPEIKNPFQVYGKTVIITMSVETVQGNTYYSQIPVALTQS